MQLDSSVDKSPFPAPVQLGNTCDESLLTALPLFSYDYASREDIEKLHCDIDQFAKTTHDVEQLRSQCQQLQAEQAKLWGVLGEDATSAGIRQSADSCSPAGTGKEAMKTQADGSEVVAHKSRVARTLVAIDRWGDAGRLKTMPGGFMTLVFAIVLVVYSIFVYVQYQDRPLLQSSDVKWSNSHGPYPLPLTCFFEHCWVSMTHDADASGQAGKCTRKIPPAQLGACFSLKGGESILLSTCYSQLPGQGVQMHWAGAPHWGEKAAKLGITGSSPTTMYGLVTTSDMQGMTEGQPVTPFLTPLRAGVVSLTYVRTDNSSLLDGSIGRTRHEWFSLALSAGRPSYDSQERAGAADSCLDTRRTWLQTQSAAATSLVDLAWTVLVMEPSFTDVKVKRPESFFMYFIGSIGGASAIADGCLLLVLMIYYKVIAAKRRVQELLAFDSADSQAQDSHSVLGQSASVISGLIPR